MAKDVAAKNWDFLAANIVKIAKGFNASILPTVWKIEKATKTRLRLEETCWLLHPVLAETAIRAGIRTKTLLKIR